VRHFLHPFGERLDEPGQAEAGGDEAAQRQVMEELASYLAERGLSTVAIFVLESLLPLSFLTAEFMSFLAPFARAFLPAGKYSLLAEALHDRRKVQWLIARLEELEEARASRGPVTRGRRPDRPGGDGHE
jgi:hypothetical protein